MIAATATIPMNNQNATPTKYAPKLKLPTAASPLKIVIPAYKMQITVHLDAAAAGNLPSRRLIRSSRRLLLRRCRRSWRLFAVDGGLGFFGTPFGGRRDFVGAFLGCSRYFMRHRLGRRRHVFRAVLGGVGDDFGVVLHGLAY